MAQVLAEIGKILTAFGLEKSLRAETSPLEQLMPLTVHERIKTGFPCKVLALAATAFGLTLGELARIIGVNVKTVHRKLASKKSLTNTESDRFYRSIRVFIFATEIFRNLDTAKQWMAERQPSLGGYIPLDLLETEAGAKEVYNLLGRIQYGVIS